MDKKMDKYDFSGWATKHNIKCSDGRTILKDAFKHCDGKKVPLVWNHQHNDPYNTLGHAILENRDEGVYAYGFFNDSETGKQGKLLVEHGDITALSIFANQLKEQSGNVMHGDIREVSLVHAGANIGAYIETVIAHSDDTDEEAVIYTGENIALYHADEQKEEPETKSEEEETLGDVLDTLTDKQKTVVYTIIGHALEGDKKDGEAQHSDENNNNENEGGNTLMKHNVFDKKEDNKDDTVFLQHSDEERAAVFADVKRYGSLKDSALAHGFTEVPYEGNTLAHGITNIDYLFPEARNLNTPPSFISRDMGWVQKVMNGMHHTPFSRIKSMFADITEADARAKGYIKGNLKVEEVFGLLKRTTSPTTIYKKQKLDRDDVIDITDFDVVSWIKGEMRMMLDEEIARAALLGDGRLSSSDDKINEGNIRPIWKDADLYTIKYSVNIYVDSTEDEKAKAFIRSVVKSRKNYKGSGEPSLYTTEDMITLCLLMEDTTGRIIYDTIEKLRTALRVKEIVTVPVMEGLTRVDEVLGEVSLMGIVVNLNDYNIGADKGGAVNMFDDFDIDYNALKYLIETRCSGALIKPYSAIALESTIVPRPPVIPG